MKLLQGPNKITLKSTYKYRLTERGNAAIKSTYFTQFFWGVGGSMFSFSLVQKL